MSFRRPPDDVESMTSLRVGNIPYKTHQDDLREVFEKFGDVGDVFIPTDRESGRPRGFAFVRFIHKRDAERFDLVSVVLRQLWGIRLGFLGSHSKIK